MESVISFLNGLFSTDTIKYFAECIFLVFAILMIMNMEPFHTVFKIVRWIFVGFYIIAQTVYEKITKRKDWIDESKFNLSLVVVIIISSLLFINKKGFTENLFENGFNVKEILINIILLLIFIGGIAIAFAIVIGFFYLLLHRPKGNNSAIESNDYFERKQIKEYNEDLQREIRQLENERDRIQTGYGLIIPSGLTEDELRRNRHRRDKLNEKIEELKSRLK